ncbi:hypothetical protein [Streptomyces sp. FH025]|uniref:hypothetical protein n=1 Tax=Streptomyces sp. FH025 TaxID=2815937 RepID=UPI001A9DD782|nr:hypothetical protein [Streptomyces sp. FH025]MBO1416459.1 hypothetical protein [Streptomyces sp. FH025]
MKVAAEHEPVTTERVRTEEGGIKQTSNIQRGFASHHRLFNQKFNIPGVVPSTAVSCSLTEVDASQTPVFGLATLHLYNVSPANGAVFVRAEIDWDTDLPIRFDFNIN